jgi:hypothetical protein
MLATLNKAHTDLGTRDRVAAAERRIDNDCSGNPNRGRAGLKRAQLELSVIESQLSAAFSSDESLQQPNVCYWVRSEHFADLSPCLLLTRCRSRLMFVRS